MLPNIALGAIIIVPVWVLAYILRPPGPTRMIIYLLDRIRGLTILERVSATRQIDRGTG